jgi:hypothetical protein
MITMKAAKLAGASVALALVAAAPAVAHHSGSMFDRSKPVTVKGVVKDFAWVNPHASIQFVADPGNPEAGKTWVIELTSPGVLTRAGWTKRTVKPGDHIEMVIGPLRTGGPAGALMSVKNLDTGVTIGARG